jgi:hypothetical protein
MKSEYGTKIIGISWFTMPFFRDCRMDSHHASNESVIRDESYTNEISTCNRQTTCEDSRDS